MDNMANHFINTLSEIANQILTFSKIIDWKEISNLVTSILHTKGNGNIIFIYGAGRSGFVGRCFAQRLMHLGIRTCFISDTITYRYTKNDLLIIVSGSGETISSLAISKKAKEIGGKIGLFTNNPESSIGKIADYIIMVEAKSKDRAISINSLAPYTSLFDITTLSILDSIGAVLMKKLSVTENDIDNHHASLE
jgi:6-phospho-3-hexuloisomerase